MNNTIKNAYEKYNFPSVNKLYQILKKEGHNIKVKDIQNYLDQQEEQQIHKAPNKKVIGTPITVAIPNFNYQADLLDFSKYGTKNKNYNWLLIVIDVLTKKAAGFPLKKKTKTETYNALHKAYNFISNGKIPMALTTDNGKEFNDVKKDNMIHKTVEVGDHRVLGVIDRFSRTIKNIVSKYMTRNQNNVWIDKIAKIINTYNNTPHSSLENMTPNEASKDTDAAIRISIQKHQDARMEQRKEFHIGDKVRLQNEKTIVSKGYEPNYSHKVYTIEKIEGNYYILDNNKKYRAYRLQKIHSKTKVTEKKDVQKIARKERSRTLLLNREDVKPERIQRKRRNWNPTNKYLEQYQ